MPPYTYKRKPPSRYRYDLEWDDQPQHTHGTVKRTDFAGTLIRWRCTCLCGGLKGKWHLSEKECRQEFRQHIGNVMRQQQFDMETVSGGPFD